jgi:hypothetical protein
LGEQTVGKIFIKGRNGFESLEETIYAEEDPFQEFLFQNPHVMGITDDDGKAIKLVPIAREILVTDEAGSSFHIDLVCLDDSGIVNIIEVKRCSDTRIRREVIGQVLDYGSQLSYSGNLDSLISLFQMSNPGLDIMQFLHGSDNDQGGFEDYLELAKTNLQAGKIRIVIAADGIPDNLRRIIEFLNKQMDPAEIIGVDLKKYSKGEMEVFTSTVIGTTEESKAKKGVNALTKQWDRDTFLTDVEEKSGVKAREIAGRLLEWCMAHNVRITYGTGANQGTVIPVYDKGNNNNMLFGIYGKGKFYFWFQWYRPPFNSPEWRIKIMDSFNEVLTNKLKIEDMTRRPGFNLSDLDDASWERLLVKFEWLIKNIEELQ